MPRGNEEVAEAFEELADLVEMSGGERYRILAYRRAAATLRGVARDLEKMDVRELQALRGVGKATAAKIREYFETGTMKALEDARTEVPEGLLELKELPGLGPKKAMLLNRELGISSLEELRRAVEEQRLRQVKGMGPKTEENLRRALKRRRPGGERRYLLAEALEVAEEMVAALAQQPAVKRVAYAGSLRRMRETIGDLDLLVASEKADEVMEAFINLRAVDRVAAAGPTKSSVIVGKRMQVDLRVVAPDEFGAALQYFTGSKDHNVKVREHAVKMGYKLSEYGLFKAEGGDRVAAETEEEVYQALGMQTPLPTMREDRGEVELALRGDLPKVVELKDIKGDLHSHSTYSDGRNSISEMAAAAAALGYRYFAVTDHARRLHGVPNLSLDDIDRQADEIEKVDQELGPRFTLLHGVELNVGSDGELDYPDEVLDRFDIVLASIHQHLGMDRAAMTKRARRALEHPAVNVLAHPTGRRMGRRDPIEIDLEEVFAAAREHGVALEINATPDRLDLRDDYVFLAREMGCTFVVSTDSHRPDRLGHMRLGVAVAQRGWVSPESVINTWPLRKLRKFLDKGRTGRAGR